MSLKMVEDLNEAVHEGHPAKGVEHKWVPNSQKTTWYWMDLIAMT